MERPREEQKTEFRVKKGMAALSLMDRRNKIRIRRKVINFYSPFNILVVKI